MNTSEPSAMPRSNQPTGILQWAQLLFCAIVFLGARQIGSALIQCRWLVLQVICHSVQCRAHVTTRVLVRRLSLSGGDHRGWTAGDTGRHINRNRWAV